MSIIQHIIVEINILKIDVEFTRRSVWRVSFPGSSFFGSVTEDSIPQSAIPNTIYEMRYTKFYPPMVGRTLARLPCGGTKYDLSTKC
jgi:hypothetical protein